MQLFFQTLTDSFANFFTSFQQFLANYCRIWFRAICHTNKHYTFDCKHLISKQNVFLSFKENKLSNMKVFHRLVKSNFFIQKGYWVQKLNLLSFLQLIEEIIHTIFLTVQLKKAEKRKKNLIFSIEITKLLVWSHKSVMLTYPIWHDGALSLTE